MKLSSKNYIEAVSERKSDLEVILSDFDMIEGSNKVKSCETIEISNNKSIFRASLEFDSGFSPEFQINAISAKNPRLEIYLRSFEFNSSSADETIFIDGRKVSL